MTALAHPYARTDARPDLTVIEGSRGKPDMLMVRATEVADLIDELTASGQEMVAFASQLELAYVNGRLDLIPAIVTRLRALGVQYRDCASPGEAA